MSQRRARRQRQLARAKQAAPAIAAPAAVQSSVPQRYEALHYTGDVTGSDKAQPGAILGCDELGRPYEVIDAEYEPCPECDPTVGWPGPMWWKSAEPDRKSCPGCHGSGGRTTVQLQYASPENIQAALAAAGVSL